MALPQFEYPRNALINFQPINDAIDSNRQNALAQRQASQADERIAMDRRRLQMAEQESAEQRQMRQVQRWGSQARVLADLPEGPQKQAYADRWYAANPQLVQYVNERGIDHRHPDFWKMLAAEAGNYDPLGEQAKRAELAKSNAQAGLATAQATNLGSTDDIREFTFAQKHGFNGSFDDWINKKREKSPLGYRTTAQGNLEAIPGGPADVKMNEKRQQDFASMQAMLQQLDEYAKSVNKVATHPGLSSNFGIPGYIWNIPGGNAADAQALLDTLRTQGAFSTLQEMRNASKTGGALGSVSDKEIAMLQNAIAPLGKAQSYQQLKDSLAGILSHIEASKQRIRNAYADHWNNGGVAAKQAPQGAPAGAGQANDPLGIR